MLASLTFKNLTKMSKSVQHTDYVINNLKYIAICDVICLKSLFTKIHLKTTFPSLLFKMFNIAETKH